MIWELRHRSPLRSVPHGQDELRADQEYAGESQDDEYVKADPVPERIQLGIRQRAGDKVKGEVEVGLGQSVIVGLV